VSPLLLHEVGISVMMSCIASDSKLEGSVAHVTTGTQSEVCPSSGELGEPVTLPTEDSLLNKLANIVCLNKSWQIVRKSALNSQSSKIASEAKAFDQDPITNLRRIESALKVDSFVFDGVTARLLPRDGREPRPLAVAKIGARIVQRAIHDTLLTNYKIKRLIKPDGKKNSFGGIKKESTKRAIEELCKCIRSGYNYYITSDIKDFFQKISRPDVHNKIFECLDDCSINSLIEQSVACEITNASSPNIKKYIDLFPKGEVGVIQGCCLSPLYGNIYLSDFDVSMNSREGLRCLRYIDDFVIIGKRQGHVLNAFKRAVEFLKLKGLDVYGLKEPDTKASSGDIRKSPINFLGCSISKTQISPQQKAKANLHKKIDIYITESLKQMKSSKGNTTISLSYINTINKINNTLKGWGGAFSFCNDKSFFNRIDKEMVSKVLKYYKAYKSISLMLERTQERQRLFGLQIVTDCLTSQQISEQIKNLPMEST
jgi:RNA-directed DNA polymerase